MNVIEFIFKEQKNIIGNECNIIYIQRTKNIIGNECYRIYIHETKNIIGNVFQRIVDRGIKKYTQQ